MATAEQIQDTQINEGTERQQEEPADQGIDAATSALTDTEASPISPADADVDAALADTVVVPDQIRMHDEVPDGPEGDVREGDAEDGDQATAVEQHDAVQGETGTGKSPEMVRTLGDMAQHGPERQVTRTTEEGPREEVAGFGADDRDDRGRSHGGQDGLSTAEHADSGDVAVAEEVADEGVVDLGQEEAGADDASDAEADYEGYGKFDAHATNETPHLDEAARLLEQDRLYNAGIGDIGLKSAGILLGVGLAVGGISVAALSGGSSPNPDTQSTEQVAAEAISPNTSLAAYSNGKLVEVTITPPADSADDQASETLVDQAEAEGAANMNGGNPKGIPQEYWAEEAFATDGLSGVAVPESAKEQYVAAQLAQKSGGQSGGAYMAAADIALGAADQQLTQGHGKIVVPVSESNS